MRKSTRSSIHLTFRTRDVRTADDFEVNHPRKTKQWTRKSSKPTCDHGTSEWCRTSLTPQTCSAAARSLPAAPPLGEHISARPANQALNGETSILPCLEIGKGGITKSVKGSRPRLQSHHNLDIQKQAPNNCACEPSLTGSPAYPI